jgi:hypothetical protein
VIAQTLFFKRFELFVFACRQVTPRFGDFICKDTEFLTFLYATGFPFIGQLFANLNTF